MLVTLGVVALVLVAIFANYSLAPQLGKHADLFGRLVNLRTLRRTGTIYLPFGTEAFTYPPGAVFLFWPILWIPTSVLPLTWTVLSLIALVGCFFVVLERLFHLTIALTLAVACWATALAAVLFAPVTECLTWGQTGTILLAAVVVDYLHVRGRSRGVLVGLATAFKIYPGLFIIVWLMRRQWRPAITALLTCVTTTVLSWILWPSSAWMFLTEQILNGSELKHFKSKVAVRASSSVSSMFMRPPFHVGLLNNVATMGLSVLVMGGGVIAAHRLWRRGFELSAMMLVLIASVIGAPLAWDHYFVFVPLLLLMPFELGWRSPLGRVAVIAAVVAVVPWFRFRKPIPGSWLVSTFAFTARNALLFSALAVIVAAFFEQSAVRVAREGAEIAATPQASTRRSMVPKGLRRSSKT